ncbi:hypothetical protein [Halomontanus rarus]|uniref:hypothetical protein n=1 Tax=Halomontanus rarus TaxID=3034020 RepID=UPI00307BF547
MDRSGDPVYEYTTDGELLGTHNLGQSFDIDVTGFGIFNDHWYVGESTTDETLEEYHAVIEDPATLSGTVRDQSGNVVPNATLVASGVREANLDADPADLESEARSLLEELEDPLPEAFDSEFDFDAHTDTDGTYALVHESRDWSVGTTHIADSTVEEPRVTVGRDREVILSLWDPTADGGWIENQVDQSFPGATTEGELVVEQLGPGGGVIDSQTYATEPVVETTGVNPLTSTDHHGVRTQLPVGVYRVSPAGSAVGSVVFTVGDPEELARSITADLESDAGALSDRADRVRSLVQEETVVQETVRADSEGRFEIQIDSGVSVASVHAIKADGEVLSGVSDPSLEDLRKARLEGYNGSVYLPSPSPSTHDVPSEDIEVRVYRSPDVPFEDLESFADLQAFLESEFLDQDLSELEGWDELVDEIDTERAERLHDNLSRLAAENEQLRALVDERLDGDLGDGDVRAELEALRASVAALEATIDAGDPSVDVGDGNVSIAFPFEGVALDEADVALLVHTPDGETDTVDPAYWSVESGGVFGDDSVVLDEYPFDDRAGLEFEVVVAGESVGSISERVPNPAVDLPTIDAVDFSTLAPGPSERVSVGVDAPAESAFSSVSSVEVFDPQGEAIGATLEGDRAVFETDGQGVYHVRLALAASDGTEFVVSEKVRAGAQSRSDPATIRARSSVAGEHAVVGEVLESASVETDGDRVSVVGVVGEGTGPGVVHIQPDAVLEGTTHEFEIGLERENGDELRSHVSTAVHLSSFEEGESIAWRNGRAFTQSGENRYGEAEFRESGAIVRSYTDEKATVTLEVLEDPGRLDRLWHWMEQRVPGTSVLGFVSGVGIAARTVA